VRRNEEGIKNALKGKRHGRKMLTRVPKTQRDRGKKNIKAGKKMGKTCTSCAEDEVQLIIK
jgi:hypothetical protein